MKQAIILDGFHQGYDIRLPLLSPEIKLLKPVTHTVCDCNPSFTDTFDHDKGICRYRVAFRSMDGEMALYSTKGKSDDFTSGRPWVMKAQYDVNPRQLFDDAYFSCHDPRAWIDADEPNDKEEHAAAKVRQALDRVRKANTAHPNVHDWHEDYIISQEVEKEIRAIEAELEGKV